MYDKLDIKKTNELYLVRQGWFSSAYTLTDKVYNYGDLSYNRFSECKASAVTASGGWTFKREKLFSRTILITNENGWLMGKISCDWFDRKSLLTLETGFQAEFYRPSIWSGQYVWHSQGYGKVMHIVSSPFCLRDTIHIDQSMTPPSLIPLLIFLGGHLTILKRQSAVYS